MPHPVLVHFGRLSISDPNQNAYSEKKHNGDVSMCSMFDDKRDCYYQERSDYKSRIFSIGNKCDYYYWKASLKSCAVKQRNVLCPWNLFRIHFVIVKNCLLPVVKWRIYWWDLHGEQIFISSRRVARITFCNFEIANKHGQFSCLKLLITKQ